jgi:hypothetical protein
MLNCKPLLLLSVCAIAASAQSPTPAGNSGSPDPVSPASKPAAQDDTPLEKQRVLGVLPNYRTAQETGVYTPITTRQKFTIALKDSVDYPVYLTSAGLAGLAQAENSHPLFGQGMKGYAKRYGSALADQIGGNMMTEAIMPTLFHQDPRYFRLGAERGGFWHRFTYAATRILVTKNDKGNWTFNSSEIVGNAAVAALGNAYYRGERTLGDNANRLGMQLTTDAVSQVLKEFWPDVRKKLFRK